MYNKKQLLYIEAELSHLRSLVKKSSIAFCNRRQQIYYTKLIRKIAKRLAPFYCNDDELFNKIRLILV